MRILVVGSGGREHALVWKLAQSPLAEQIYVAPGNGGTATVAQNVPLAADDIAGLVEFCKQNRIDLVVPGPELPLVLGLADRLAEAGIPCFGPDAWCARLEGSKSFAKEFMKRAGVPTARASVFDNMQEARSFLRTHPGPWVVKADGLAAGKGVVVATSTDEALAALDSLEAGGTSRVVIEEKLVGEEVSLLCLCNGVDCVPLPSAQDHKAALDGDQGPNTGGMGAYSPAPALPDAQLEAMADKTVRPVLAELAKAGHPFVGVLYAGLMLTPDGPKVLEYNVRFGDPECEPLMLRLESDLAQLLLDACQGKLAGQKPKFRADSALGVVLAAEGYPGKYEKGQPIQNAESRGDDAVVFHAGTRQTPEGLISAGGRVLCVTARGNSLEEARNRAYARIAQIRMPHSRYRTDIGVRGLAHLRKIATQ